MKTGSGYLPLEVRYPLKGLNVSVPSTQIEPEFTPNLENMIIKDGVAFKRSGYGELVAQTLVGTVMGLVDFEKLDGTRILVALTSKRQYKYTSSVWNDITTLIVPTGYNIVSTSATTFVVATDVTLQFPIAVKFLVQGTVLHNGEYTVTAVSYSAPNTTITVASTPGITSAVGTIKNYVFNVVATSATSNWIKIAGDFTAIMVAGVKLRVAGTVANDAEYLVASSSYSAPNTQINITTLTGATGGAAGTVGIISELTTIAGDYIDYEVGTDTNTHRLYTTNGRDRVRFWDGTTSAFTLWAPVYANFVTCKTIRVFFDHLMLGNVTTTTNEPKVVVWSDAAAFDHFESGDAGANLLPGLAGSILNLQILADRLIIYAEDTIASVSFVGFPVVFSFQIILQGTRLISSRAIVSFGSAHLYVSQENIYFFDGSSGIRSVGNYVRMIYKQALSHEFAYKLFCFNDVAKRAIYIIVPTSNTTSIALILDYDIFDLNQFIWTKATYSDLPAALGFYARRSGTSPTWNNVSPTLTWQQDYDIWNAEGGQINFPVRLLGSGSRVFVMDETVGLDDGDAYTGSYETLDFVAPPLGLSVLGRWLEIEADLAGSSVLVSYSTDLGQTWTVVGTQALTGKFQQYHFPIDIVSRTLRIKFESSLYFSLRWIRPWVRSTAAR